MAREPFALKPMQLQRSQRALEAFAVNINRSMSIHDVHIFILSNLFLILRVATSVPRMKIEMVAADYVAPNGKCGPRIKGCIDDLSFRQKGDTPV